MSHKYPLLVRVSDVNGEVVYENIVNTPAELRGERSTMDDLASEDA